MSPIALRSDWNHNDAEHEFLDVRDALQHIQKHPSYEIIGDGALRPYGDLDCKEFKGTLEEFKVADQQLRNAFIEHFQEVNQSITITTSSKYPKLSLRWYIPHVYLKSRLHAKEFAKKLYENITLPQQITADYSVYSSYKKMRTFYTSKPGEIRPFKLVQGEVEDTIISYIPNTAALVDIQLPKITPASTSSSNADAHLLIKVVNALPIKFIEEYDTWITIGMVFFNEDLTMEDWDEVSKRSTNYDGKLQDHWTSFRKDVRRVTAATLWKWLKDNNRTEFWNLMENRNDFWKLIALINHADVARFFYNIHPHAYLYNDVTGWYSISPSTNIWTHSDKCPNLLKRHIADTFQELAMDTKKAELKKYEEDSAKEKDKKKQEELTEAHASRITLIHSAYLKFGSSEFCNGVMTFLSSFYNDPLLQEKMDRNPNIFSFNNGVYDLQTLTFRPLLPTDYVSVTTGYNYNPTSNETIRKEINDFLFSLFENNSTVEYLLFILASCLLGNNSFQEFYVFTGSGGNGKSLITLLLKNLFGGYYMSVDASLLTKPVERRDQPIPALVDARTSRMLVSSEPEATDKLQVGLLKKISGGDTIEARTLHSKNIYKYVAMFKLIILANDIPALNKIDKGIQRRMRILRFPFVFKRQEEVSEPFHRLAVLDLEKIVQQTAWRDEMLLILMEKYAQVSKMKASPTCDSVREQSDDYIDENNPLKSWLEQHYTFGGDAIISARDLKRQYLSDMGIDGIDDRKFGQLLGFNGLTKKKMNYGAVYVGITRKEEEV